MRYKLNLDKKTSDLKKRGNDIENTHKKSLFFYGFYRFLFPNF